MRVWLEITSEYTSPTVNLRAFRANRTTPITLTDSQEEWPITMPQVSGQDRWEVILDADALDVRVGQVMHLEVLFDNGPENRRVFTGRVTVRRG